MIRQGARTLVAAGRLGQFARLLPEPVPAAHHRHERLIVCRGKQEAPLRTSRGTIRAGAKEVALRWR